MKTLWQFVFLSKDIFFKKTHNYKGKLNLTPKVENLQARKVEFEISIKPREKSDVDKLEQTGDLTILLQGSPEDTKDDAYFIAHNTAEQISFSKPEGDFRIRGGFVSGERIPESDEERQIIGNKPCFVEMHLVEVDTPQEFDSSSITRISNHANVDVAIRQFNTAKSALNPVDRFLGFFKSIEQLCSAGSKKRKSFALLSGSDLLLSAASRIFSMKTPAGERPITREHFHSLIKRLIRVRDNCAHLRTEQKIGYVRGDLRIIDELEPLLEVLHQLAYEAIKEKAVG